MDSQNNNNNDRPFGTFDWSGTFSGNVSRPKDITSDMWTPISAGKTFEKAPPSRLDDRESQASPLPRRQPTKKKPSSAKNASPKKSSGKSQPKKRPSQSAANSASRQGGARSGQRPPSGGQSANKRPPQNNRARLSAEKRRRLEKERERRNYENDRRRYERSSESFDRQRFQGSSREEISRKRARKKRRSKRFYAVTITVVTLFVALAAMLVYCFAVGSPVSLIAVKGESVYSSEQIVSSCGVAVGDNIFVVSEKKVNRALTAALPYVGSVEVKREFPDKLTLTVTATSEKYLITNKTGYICLDKSGKVLSTKKQKLKAGVFRLDGFKGQTVQNGTVYEPCKEDKKKYEKACEIVSAIEKLGIEKANVLKLSSLDDVIVVYDKRFNIYLGSADKIEKKLELASQVIAEAVTETNTGYIDVSFDSRAYFSEGNMNRQ